MDDCSIGTLLKDLALHIEIIYFLFDLLAKHGLHLKLSKSVFLQPQMDFLGIRISKEGVTIDPAKVAGLRDYPCDILNLRQARGFLGIAGYHRMFCKDFSTIAAPITKLTGKDVPFEWGPAQCEAQDKIITLITSSPVLIKPDPSRQFELEVDASQIGTGAILYQRDPPTTRADGSEKPGPCRPVGFHSTKIYHNGAKLPHLRPRIPSHHEGTSLLDTLAQRNPYPCLGIHRSRQFTLLQRPLEDRPARRWLLTQARTIQHLTGIQTRSNKQSGRLVKATGL